MKCNRGKKYIIEVSTNWQPAHVGNPPKNPFPKIRNSWQSYPLCASESFNKPKQRKVSVKVRLRKYQKYEKVQSKSAGEKRLNFNIPRCTNLQGENREANAGQYKAQRVCRNLCHKICSLRTNTYMLRLV